MRPKEAQPENVNANRKLTHDSNFNNIMCSFTFVDGCQCIPRRAGNPYLCVFHTRKASPLGREAQASLRVATLCNGYYDFPLRMSFCKITESFRRAAQRVTSIYDRHNFS